MLCLLYKTFNPCRWQNCSAFRPKAMKSTFVAKSAPYRCLSSRVRCFNKLAFKAPHSPRSLVNTRTKILCSGVSSKKGCSNPELTDSQARQLYPRCRVAPLHSFVRAVELRRSHQLHRVGDLLGILDTGYPLFYFLQCVHALKRILKFKPRSHSKIVLNLIHQYPRYFNRLRQNICASTKKAVAIRVCFFNNLAFFLKK